VPLLLHLGHWERAFNSTITPHWTSAMAMFGYFAIFYICLLLLETWFAFRPYIVEQAQKRKGLIGRVYQVLTLGSYDVGPTAMHYDKKWIFYLAILGIPAAHGLHGYVGFVFGSLKSRDWWSSDLLPVIFLFSAIISCVSLLTVLYVVSCKIRKITIDLACMKGLAYTIWAFIIVALVLEGLEFANIVYKGREGVEMILQYVTGPLLIPYFILQFAIGSITPFLWLSLPAGRHHRQGHDRRRHHVRVPGAVFGIHDALERGDRRTGNLQDR
jgi:Ni/Fe-hydrogenase subunit HybB-like protein